MNNNSHFARIAYSHKNRLLLFDKISKMECGKEIKRLKSVKFIIYVLVGVFTIFPLFTYAESITNINGIVADEKFKPTLYETAEAISNMSKQLAPVIGAVNAKDFAEDLNSVMHNLNDISTAVNKMAHDDNLKKKFVDSVDNLNVTLCSCNRKW